MLLLCVLTLILLFYSQSGVGSIYMQVSFLYLIFIFLHFAKITILSYLQDIWGLSLLSYLRYFFKVSSPTLQLCAPDLVVPAAHRLLPALLCARQVAERVEVLARLEARQRAALRAVVAHLAPLRPRLRRRRKLIVPRLDEKQAHQ